MHDPVKGVNEEYFNIFNCYYKTRQMITTVKATTEDAELLADIGGITFVESHGSSAAPEEIDTYVNEKYSPDVLRQELSDSRNIYYVIYHDEKPAGYSKIIFDFPHPNIPEKNITKLERIYLLKEFYGFKVGAQLFNFNLELSKNNTQAGMWLYVWEENHRAIAFYEKAGFKIIGSGDFRLTQTHSNPNHLMYLKY